MSISTIVAALALETENDPVVGRALQLGRQHRARVIFVHVVDDSMHEATSMPGSFDAAAVRTILELDATDRIRQLTGSSGLDMPAEIVVDVGKPFQIINQVVERDDADLVVIGPGSAKNIREKVFGSTADRIVRSTSRPVLVARSDVFNAYRRLVVAMDLSAEAQAAAQGAILLAPDAAVEFVHAIETPLGFELAMRKAGTPQVEIDRYRKARSREARRQISAAVAEFVPPVAGPKLRVVHGAAGQVLVRLSRSARTDLIALGAPRGGAISQALLGSVARHVLRSAGCDVFVAG